MQNCFFRNHQDLGSKIQENSTQIQSEYLFFGDHHGLMTKIEIFMLAIKSVKKIWLPKLPFLFLAEIWVATKKRLRSNGLKHIKRITGVP